MPEKTSLHAQIFDRLERSGYTVEKVLLETYPGFYLGGILSPAGQTGTVPLCGEPHGHWSLRPAGKYPLVSVPARCINLARQGYCIRAMTWSDITIPIILHGVTRAAPGGGRADFPCAGPVESQRHGAPVVGQCPRSRFVSSVPMSIGSRIGATGASGGGTQTFLLMAVDDRIKAAAPVNMISAIMQGNGCEEAPNLRVGAFNVMFGAMMAPRPLLMVSATGDWTRNTPKEEFPAVRGIYKLLDAEQNVESVQIDEVHNYNRESREAVYTFFNARLLGGKGPVTEQRYRVEQVQDLLGLFGKERPANAVTMERYIADRIGEAKRDMRGSGRATRPR